MNPRRLHGHDSMGALALDFPPRNEEHTMHKFGDLPTHHRYDADQDPVITQPAGGLPATGQPRVSEPEPAEEFTVESAAEHLPPTRDDLARPNHVIVSDGRPSAQLLHGIMDQHMGADVLAGGGNSARGTR
jgi:hypothetical protein